MTDRRTKIRQWRAYEFMIADHAGVSRRLFVLDRNDGLKDQVASEFGRLPVNTFRINNIAIFLDNNPGTTLIAKRDATGWVTTEIIRLLNQTGFRGKYLIVCDDNTIPMHMVKRLKKIAIDFDLGSTSVKNLVQRHCMNAQDTLPVPFTSAVG